MKLTLLLVGLCSVAWAIQPDSSRKPITIAEAPYFAWLHIPAKAGGDSCGATILDKRWLLSARHCLPFAFTQGDFIADWKVAVGTDKRSSTTTLHTIDYVVVYDDPNKSQRWTTRKMSRHDIVLVHVSTDIAFGANVKKAKLPAGPLSADDRAAGLKLVGFGSKSTGGFDDQLQTHKNATIKPILSPKQCTALLKASNTLDEGVPGTLLGYKPRDAGAESSQGDSGGGYIKKGGDGSFTVYGVVSGSIGTGSNSFKAVVNVAWYTDWIKAVKTGTLTHALKWAVSFNPPPVADFANASDRSHWGAADGCHCNLKAAPTKSLPPDPDCAYPYSRRRTKGCAMSQICQNGRCTDPPSNSLLWACSAKAYQDGNLCDIGCGTQSDPDCLFKDLGMATSDYGCAHVNERDTTKVYHVEGDRCVVARCCKTQGTGYCQWIENSQACSALPNYKAWLLARAKPWENAAHFSFCDGSEALGEAHKCGDGPKQSGMLQQQVKAEFKGRKRSKKN